MSVTPGPVKKAVTGVTCLAYTHPVLSSSAHSPCQHPPPPAPCPQVPEAVCLPTLTYNEAWELSYFGANVLHPRTTLPAMRYKIPIAIRNFFNLDAPGVKGGDCWGGWVCVCM